MSADDDYSFEKISQIRQKERRKPLSQLPINFYERFAERLEKLKQLFQEENQKDPTSLKSMMFADEIRKTKLIFDEIRGRRKRKIILMALSNKPEDSEPPSELLPIERKLFDDIVAALKENQKAVEGVMGLEVIEEAEEVSADQMEIKTEDLIVMEPVAQEAEEQHEVEVATVTDQGEEKDLAMVRVLGDIGSFMSPDKRSYNLRKEDILEIPTSIANILVEHKKAELYSAWGHIGLLVLERNDATGAKQRFFIVDMHHHIGREEKVKNLNPAGPDGSYIFLKSVFWGNQWKPGLVKELEENPDEYALRLPEDKNITKPHPAVAEIMDMPSTPFGLDMVQMFKNTFLSDTIVAFPMGDTYRDKEVSAYSEAGKSTPLYAYSNDKMIDVTSRFPNSLRFIPFGRVVPTQDNASEEMERAVNELNIKGFKLHPKTDGYPIDDESVVDTLAKSASLDVPCLFHTSFLNEVRDLAGAVNGAVLKLVRDSGFKGDEKYRDMDLVQRQRFWDMTRTVNSLRVVVGHCGWHTSEELFQILKHPCMYGEVSGIKGDVVRKFFKVACETQGYEYDNRAVLEPLENEGISPENLKRMFPDPSSLPNYNGWSSKIMFGTDFPFLDQNQAIDVFRALLSKDFPGNNVDITNFLGLNALGVLFPKMNQLGMSRVPGRGPEPETVPTHKDLLANFIKGAESRNLKKTEVNITFNPMYSRYPCSTIRQDFLLRIKAASLDKAYHVMQA